jgi:hypothetical protein
MRLSQAEAIVANGTVVCAMLQADWRRPTAGGTLDVFAHHLPFYGMLSSNQADSRQGQQTAE